VGDSVDDELERLDREWARERERYLIAGRPPSRLAALLAGSCALITGAAMTFLGMTRPGQPTAVMFGPMLVLGGLIVLFLGGSKARAYRDARQRYLERRAKVEQSP
jgi:hypothetical protein